MNSIFIRKIPLPHCVEGVTVPDSEGNFNVYINANLSNESQRKATEHELRHIKREHFYSSNEISACESEAQSGSCRLTGYDLFG